MRLPAPRPRTGTGPTRCLLLATLLAAVLVPATGGSLIRNRRSCLVAAPAPRIQVIPKPAPASSQIGWWVYDWPNAPEKEWILLAQDGRCLWHDGSWWWSGGWCQSPDGTASTLTGSYNARTCRTGRFYMNSLVNPGGRSGHMWDVRRPVPEEYPPVPPPEIYATPLVIPAIVR
jgi:hypothetical protein